MRRVVLKIRNHVLIFQYRFIFKRKGGAKVDGETYSEGEELYKLERGTASEFGQLKSLKKGGLNIARLFFE